MFYGAVLGGGIGLGAAMYIGSGAEQKPEGCAADLNEPAACISYKDHQSENELMSSTGFKVITTLGLAAVGAAYARDTGPIEIKPPHHSDHHKIDTHA